MAAAHWELAGGGVLVGNPPAAPLDDVEPLIELALASAAANRVTGPAVTPYVLDYLHRESGGRTRSANRRLVVDNAGLAADIAVAAVG